jgi:hypothetical protein
MINLNKEAEERGIQFYTREPEQLSRFNAVVCDFIAGANSKYVQAKIIQAQIDVLKSIRTVGFEEAFVCLEIYNKVNELQQQLKQLEDEI